MSAARHYKARGRYNLLNTSEYSEQVVLTTPHGTVSAMWDDGDCPHDEDMRPSEVSELIRERLGRYLFMSDREAKLAICDAVKDNAARIDADWLNAQAAAIRQRAVQMLKQAQDMEADAAALMAEATGEQA